MAELARVGQQAGAVESKQKRLARLVFLLALLPMVLIAAVINRYGVNVPYGDEWSSLALLEKWDAHQLALADLIREHNGHRILIPRLIYLAFVQFAHGNTRAEMFFSLLLCVLSSAGIYLLLRRTVSGSTTSHLATWALINLFLFSPIQAENWLWGFQFQIFLSNLCLVGAIVTISSRADMPRRFAGACALAIAGTLSFGNGLLIWPAVAVVLICQGEKWRVVALWAGAALLVGCPYFWGYHGSGPSGAVNGWLDYLTFFAAFMGAPLARIPNHHPLVLPVIIGSILTTAYLVAVCFFLRRRDSTRQAPWLALGMYAIGSGALVAVARTHGGVQHALDSRYTTVSVILLVSLIGLAASLLFQEGPHRSWTIAKRNLLASIMVGTLIVLFAINVPSEWRYLRLHHGFRSQGKAALEFSKVLDAESMLRSNLLIREDQQTMARYLATLDRFHLSSPPRRETAELRDAEDRPVRATQEFGAFESLEIESGGGVVAAGWSYLPGEGRPPACVVLAYGSAEKWTAFALSDRRENRLDVQAKYKIKAHDVGWRGVVLRGLLPPDAREISAWALNANTGETFRLPGSFTVQR